MFQLNESRSKRSTSITSSEDTDSSSDAIPAISTNFSSGPTYVEDPEKLIFLPVPEQSIESYPSCKLRITGYLVKTVKELKMSLSEQRLFRFQRPDWVNSATTRSLGVYAAGAIFSLGFYLLLDAAVWSHSHNNGSIIHVNFTDWLPFIFSSLGMLIINSIEKTRLSADNFSYSGSGVAWKARVILFLGFASLAGGMAGGIAVLVLKYVMGEAVWPTIYMGIANVLSNTAVMLSSIILWISQNMEDEYSYNLAL